MTSVRAAAPRSTRRHRPSTPTVPLWRRPPGIALALCAVAAGVFYGLRHHEATHAQVQFVRDGAAVPPLELTFFPDQLAFAAPSPPPPLGHHALAGASAATFAADLVPETAVVRYRGNGVGTGYLHLRLGQPTAPVTLRPPRPVRGRVGEPIAFWNHGWRCAGLRPIAGAEVTVMGGGEHGIDLGSAVTDAEGYFTVDGVDGTLDGLGLRVRAAGFALAHEPLDRFRDPVAGTSQLPVVAVAPGAVHRGQVDVPAGVDATTLRVLARGLPGVQAIPAADGTFRLEHVPLGMQPRLLLLGLPATWTHLPTRSAADATTRFEIVPAVVVRGRVVDATSGRGLAGAMVWCGDQGVVRADADGHYELPRQLPGDVVLEAQWDHLVGRRRTPWLGRRRIVLEPGTTPDHVDILVSAN